MELTITNIGTKIADKVNKPETMEDKKAQQKEERRSQVRSEKLTYMSMPTKQLVEIVQSGQKKEIPTPSRAQLYKRAEQIVDGKVNRTA